MEALHRILSGQALTSRQVTAAGLFVLVWFTMDLIQFVDMVAGWLRP